MGKLRILGKNGDTVIEFDRKSILNGVVCEAQTEFATKVKEHGWLAFSVADDGKKKIIYDFDPSAENIVLSPPVVGG